MSEYSTDRDSRRPVIGVTVFPRTPVDDTDQVVDGVDRRYITSIERAGGVVVLLPTVRPADVPAVLDLVDGLVLTGGGDIEPHRYGRVPTADLRDPSPDRDAAELAMVAYAREHHLPLLGICRGMQCLSVASGGTLLQDIGQLDDTHPSNDLDLECHDVTVVPSTELHSLLGVPQSRVNSQHHQALEVLPAGFRVAAIGPAGVVEAIESTNGWWAVGVQWHPEALPHSPASSRLFEALIQRALARRDLRSGALR